MKYSTENLVILTREEAEKTLEEWVESYQYYADKYDGITWYYTYDAPIGKEIDDILEFYLDEEQAKKCKEELIEEFRKKYADGFAIIDRYFDTKKLGCYFRSEAQDYLKTHYDEYDFSTEENDDCYTGLDL